MSIIVNSKEYKTKIKSGINKLADFVGKSLGPNGSTLQIKDEITGKFIITKDGIRIAKSFKLDDLEEQAGVAVILGSSEASAKIGDGTTSAIVLARDLYNKLDHYISLDNINRISLLEGTKDAMHETLEVLNSETIKIDDKNRDLIEKVAYISSGDSQYAKHISDIYHKIGMHGSITVEESQGRETSTEIIKGMSFDRGTISNYFLMDKGHEKHDKKLEDAYILIYDRKISSHAGIISLLEMISRSGKPLLMITEDLEGEALNTIVINNLRGTIQVVAVKTPGYGDNRQGMLEDIAIMTNGKVIGKNNTEDIEHIENWSHYLGKAKSVTISKDQTIIINDSHQEQVSERIKDLQEKHNNAKSEYDKEQLSKRISKLSGGIGIIKVAHPIDIVRSEIKDRLDDAVHAVKSAIQSGVLVGGGITLLRAQQYIEKNIKHNKNLKHINLDKYNNDIDYKYGITAFLDSLPIILETIIYNTYKNNVNEQVILFEEIKNSKEQNYGFDARNRICGDIYKSGIVDAYEVLSGLLQHATAAAISLINTDGLIYQKDKEVAAPNNHNPMMY